MRTGSSLVGTMVDAEDTKINNDKKEANIIYYLQLTNHIGLPLLSIRSTTSTSTSFGSSSSSSSTLSSPTVNFPLAIQGLISGIYSSVSRDTANIHDNVRIRLVTSSSSSSSFLSPSPSVRETIDYGRTVVPLPSSSSSVVSSGKGVLVVSNIDETSKLYDQRTQFIDPLDVGNPSNMMMVNDKAIDDPYFSSSSDVSLSSSSSPSPYVLGYQYFTVPDNNTKDTSTVVSSSSSTSTEGGVLFSLFTNNLTPLSLFSQSQSQSLLPLPVPSVSLPMDDTGIIPKNDHIYQNLCTHYFLFSLWLSSKEWEKFILSPNNKIIKKKCIPLSNCLESLLYHNLAIPTLYPYDYLSTGINKNSLGTTIYPYPSWLTIIGGIGVHNIYYGGGPKNKPLYSQPFVTYDKIRKEYNSIRRTFVTASGVSNNQNSVLSPSTNNNGNSLSHLDNASYRACHFSVDHRQPHDTPLFKFLYTVHYSRYSNVTVTSHVPLTVADWLTSSSLSIVSSPPFGRNDTLRTSDGSKLPSYPFSHATVWDDWINLLGSSVQASFITILCGCVPIYTNSLWERFIDPLISRYLYHLSTTLTMPRITSSAIVPNSSANSIPLPVYSNFIQDKDYPYAIGFECTLPLYPGSSSSSPTALIPSLPPLSDLYGSSGTRSNRYNDDDKITRIEINVQIIVISMGVDIVNENVPNNQETSVFSSAFPSSSSSVAYTFGTQASPVRILLIRPVPSVSSTRPNETTTLSTYYKQCMRTIGLSFRKMCVKQPSLTTNWLSDLAHCEGVTYSLHSQQQLAMYWPSPTSLQTPLPNNSTEATVCGIFSDTLATLSRRKGDTKSLPYTTEQKNIHQTNTDDKDDNDDEDMNRLLHYVDVPLFGLSTQVYMEPTLLSSEITQRLFAILDSSAPPADTEDDESITNDSNTEENNDNESVATFDDTFEDVSASTSTQIPKNNAPNSNNNLPNSSNNPLSSLLPSTLPFVYPYAYKLSVPNVTDLPSILQIEPEHYTVLINYLYENMEYYIQQLPLRLRTRVPELTFTDNHPSMLAKNDLATNDGFPRNSSVIHQSNHHHHNHPDILWYPPGSIATLLHHIHSSYIPSRTLHDLKHTEPFRWLFDHDTLLWGIKKKICITTKTAIVHFDLFIVSSLVETITNSPATTEYRTLSAATEQQRSNLLHRLHLDSVLIFSSETELFDDSDSSVKDDGYNGGGNKKPSKTSSYASNLVSVDDDTEEDINTKVRVSIDIKNKKESSTSAEKSYSLSSSSSVASAEIPSHIPPPYPTSRSSSRKSSSSTSTESVPVLCATPLSIRSSNDQSIDMLQLTDTDGDSDFTFIYDVDTGETLRIPVAALPPVPASSITPPSESMLDHPIGATLISRNNSQNEGLSPKSVHFATVIPKINTVHQKDIRTDILSLAKLTKRSTKVDKIVNDNHTDDGDEDIIDVDNKWVHPNALATTSTGSTTPSLRTTVTGTNNRTLLPSPPVPSSAGQNGKRTLLYVD